MNIRFVICANSVAVDQRHNSLSIFHAIEEWNVPAFPFVIPYMVVVSLLDRSPEEPDELAGVQLIFTLGAQELFRQPFEGSFQGRLRMRAIAEISGLVIPGPGELNVTIQIGERLTSTWAMAINDIGRPVVQPALNLQ
jgi:hypothetical protein